MHAPALGGAPLGINIGVLWVVEILRLIGVIGSA